MQRYVGAWSGVDDCCWGVGREMGCLLDNSLPRSASGVICSGVGEVVLGE